MNAPYGHTQERTDDSVLSHDGLAPLVSEDAAGTLDATRWGTGGDRNSLALQFRPDETGYERQHELSPHASSRYSPDLPSPGQASWTAQSSVRSAPHQYFEGAPSFPPSTYRPSHASFGLAHPNQFRASRTSHLESSFTSPASLSSLSSYVGHPSSETGGAYDAYARGSNDVDTTGGDEPRKLFDGFGGRYQHGVGFERDLLGAGPGQAGKYSEARVAKRMRRLQREFGDKDARTSGQSARGVLDTLSMKEAMKKLKEERQREEARTGVDDKGRLVVPGRKKRVAMRWCQALGAVAVGVSSIGASLLTHPRETPPPSGTMPLVCLYVLPFLSLLLTVYLFVLRPCLFARRARKAVDTGPGSHARVPGTFSLLQAQQQQVQSSGWCSCLGQGRNRVPRHGGSAQGYQPTSINLIVDPSLFPHLSSSARDRDDRERETASRRRRRKEKRQRSKKAARQRERERLGAVAGSDVDTDLLSSSPSSEASWSTDSDEPGPNATNPQSFSSILSHVALETRWLAARKSVKWNVFADALLGTIWGGVGVWAIGFNGKRCPSGSFEGWCNLYNSALAFAILLSLAFFTSCAFDCLDLARTKVSPRHRQQRLTDFESRTAIV